MFDQQLDLPLHPSRRHPLTGQPLQALWVRPDGRVMWPILGGAPDTGDGNTGAAGAGGAGGGDTGAGAGAGGAGTGTAAGAGGAQTSANATDDQGNDLGYPKDTPIAEMSDKEQAAYWRHNARKHENRWKGIVGDRSPDAIKADLDAYAQIQREQQTPAEQALNDARSEGKQAGLKEARTEAATAILRGALENAGLTGADLDETAASVNIDTFITDQGVDNTKISNFAKRFTPAGTGGQQHQQRRDFGGGNRNHQRGSAGANGSAEADKRFGAKQ